MLHNIEIQSSVFGLQWAKCDSRGIYSCTRKWRRDQKLKIAPVFISLSRSDSYESSQRCSESAAFVLHLFHTRRWRPTLKLRRRCHSGTAKKTRKAMCTRVTRVCVQACIRVRIECACTRASMQQVVELRLNSFSFSTRRVRALGTRIGLRERTRREQENAPRARAQARLDRIIARFSSCIPTSATDSVARCVVARGIH